MHHCSFVPLFAKDARTHLERRLSFFFQEDNTRNVLVPLLSRTNSVSLRLLDWMAVNMAKQDLLVCTTPAGEMCNIHGAYKTTLAAYAAEMQHLILDSPCLQSR